MPVVAGLDFPSGMTIGPRDVLYVSVCGYGGGASAGAVVGLPLPE